MFEIFFPIIQILVAPIGCLLNSYCCL